MIVTLIRVARDTGRNTPAIVVYRTLQVTEVDKAGGRRYEAGVDPPTLPIQVKPC
jgi:hypothetical protein